MYGKGACHMWKRYVVTRKMEYQKSPVDMRIANTEIHAVSNIAHTKYSPQAYSRTVTQQSHNCLVKHTIKCIGPIFMTFRLTKYFPNWILDV